MIFLNFLTHIFHLYIVISSIIENYWFAFRSLPCLPRDKRGIFKFLTLLIHLKRNSFNFLKYLQSQRTDSNWVIEQQNCNRSTTIYTTEYNNTNINNNNSNNNNINSNNSIMARIQSFKSTIVIFNFIIYHVISSPQIVSCQLELKKNTLEMPRTEGTVFLKSLRNTRLVRNILYTVHDLELSQCLFESTVADAKVGSINFNTKKKICVVNKALDNTSETNSYLTSEKGWVYYEKVS